MRACVQTRKRQKERGVRRGVIFILKPNLINDNNNNNNDNINEVVIKREPLYVLPKLGALYTRGKKARTVQ